MMQTDKSATLSTHNTQTLFDPIPIADKATRYKGGGDTRNNDGSANGLGIGEPGAPAYTLTAADRHAVGCPCYSIDDMKMQNTYIWEEQANTLAARDYKGAQAVAYPITYQKVTGPLMANSHPGSYTGQDAFSDMLVATEYILSAGSHHWSAADCKVSQITGQRNWGYQNQRRKISITGERCSERRWKPWARAKRKRQTTRSANG